MKNLADLADLADMCPTMRKTKGGTVRSKSDIYSLGWALKDSLNRILTLNQLNYACEN